MPAGAASSTTRTVRSSFGRVGDAYATGVTGVCAGGATAGAFRMTDAGGRTLRATAASSIAKLSIQMTGKASIAAIGTVHARSVSAPHVTSAAEAINRRS